MSRNRNILSQYAKIFLPSPDVIQKCINNKIEVIRIAESNNIRVPTTYYFVNYEDYQKSKKGIKFPVIVKSNSEIYKKAPIYCKNLQSLDIIIIDYYKSFGFLPLIQEYISGLGVGFFGLYDRGNLVQFFMHMRLRENPISGGPSACAMSIYNEKLYFYGKKILDSLNWNGVAMVEFKLSDSEFYFMEINPKFWGSHDLAISCGINFAELLIKMGKGSNLNFIDYPRNIKFHWPFSEEFQLLLKKPTVLPSILMDFLDPRVKSNIDINDFAPHLYELLYSIYKLIGKYLRIFRDIFVFGFRVGFIKNFSELLGIPFLKYSKLEDGLAFGNRPSFLGLLYLKIHGYNAILDLREEFDRRESDRVEYKNIPIKEYFSPTLEQIEEAIEYIKKHKNKGVYVHCRQGISRAPLIMAAFIMKEKKMNHIESIKVIKK